MTHASRSLAALLSLALASACQLGTEIDGVEPEHFVDDPGADQGEIPLDGQRRPDLEPGAPLATAALDLVVPAPGEGIFAEALLEDGTSETVLLETDRDGAVWQTEVTRAIDPDDGDELSPVALAACADGAYSLLPWRWNRTFEWRFFAATTPSYLSPGAVEDVLKRSTTAITRSRNSCGLADLVSATHRYLGRTSRPMSSGGPCGGANGESSVAFGELRPGVLAVTCTYFAGGVARESDMRLNKAVRWFTRRPAGCSGAFSLAGVAVHERGHTFGLGHASPQATHAALTMSPGIAPCTSADATLGLGDVRGLRRKY
jgi:hypothetical protein